MTPLVGRTAQLEQLDRALSMAAAGRFTAVEISGEPGIGKTRMLAELGQRAGASGLPVYSGRATEFEQEVPFGMYAEALDPLVRGTAPVWSGQDRVQIYIAVRRLLAEASPAGAVLLLDDLHWADQPSLELTEYLIRKPPRRPLLVAIAFRSARPPARLIDAIDHHGPAAVRISLPELGEADLVALLPEVPARRRDLILRASRGNPLYVQALTRLPDDTLAALVGDHDTGEPGRHILAGLAAEMLIMDPAVRAVAHAAAVAGDQATVHLVAHVVRQPVAAVAAALDQLYGLGHVDVDGVWCRFRHPLMRAAARALYGPAREATAHARIAEFLRTHDGPLPVLAHHTERCARTGDETAARTLIEAGQAFAYSAPVQATRWLAAALRILPGSGPLGELRPTVQLMYARTLGLSGNLDRSRTVLADLQRADGPVRTEAETFSAVVARLRGDINEAAALLDAQLRRGQLGPAAEGRLRVQLAAIDALREDSTGAVRHAERALGLLGGDPSAFTAAAQGLRAFGALYDGRTGPARSFISSALRLVDAVSDVALRPHVELFGPLAWVEVHLGQLAAAARHLARAKDVVESAGQSSALPYLLVVEAALRTRMGRLDQAVRLARDAAAGAQRVGSVEMQAMADAVLLRPLLWSAGPAAAIAVARRLTDSGRPRSAMWRRVAQVNLALAYVAAGDPHTCLGLLAGPAEAWPPGPPTMVPRQVLRAVAHAQLGDIPAARGAAAQAHRVAVRARLPYELGLAGYARAYVAARAQRYDLAVSLAGRAAARFAVAEAPLESALAHHLAGSVHMRAGRPRPGREALGRAQASYRDCGAGWLRSITAGDPSLGRLSSDASGLTVREREIADLVTAGLSNQEIAARLFLSRRTVESHLSRIFTKLDVRSRTAMVSRLQPV